MKSSFVWVIGGSIALLGILALSLSWGSLFETGPQRGKPGESLRLYCAAGMRPAVQPIIDEYQEAYQVEINVTYAGSGALLSSIQAADTGDWYLAADASYMVEARKLELIDETAPIAWQSPVIAFPKELEGKITGVEDLASGDYRVSLANPDVAAISRASRKLLSGETTADGEDLWTVIFEKKVVARDTVNAVANDLKDGSAELGIVWDATAKQYDELAFVRVPQFEAKRKQINVAVLKTTKSAPRALHFLRYLTSRDKGLATFDQLGYDVVEGDKWAEKPKLTIFAGGLNRPAVYDQIRAFEERENVEITDSYNGCGILVGQIKSGQKPDMYFACDITFLEQVQQEFQDAINLSGTDMVIIVNNESPKKDSVKTLADLAQPGLKVGFTHPDKSALGALTKTLLEKNELWEMIEPNIRDTPATADRLVEHVIFGTLDAAIVYKANTTLQADKLEVVVIDDPSAHAVQPIAVGANSDYKYLTSRLVDHLRTTASQEKFKQLGFEWLESTPVDE